MTPSDAYDRADILIKAAIGKKSDSGVLTHLEADDLAELMEADDYPTMLAAMADLAGTLALVLQTAITPECDMEGRYAAARQLITKNTEACKSRTIGFFPPDRQG